MLSAGIGAVGSLFKGITGLIAGNRQEDAFRKQGEEAEMQAGVNSEVALQQGNAAAGEAAARTAANGGGFVGSSMGVIQDLSNQAMFNARSKIYQGNAENQRDIYQGQVARAQGMSDMVGGVIGAAGSLAGGFMRASLFTQQKSYFGALRGDPYALMMAG